MIVAVSRLAHERGDELAALDLNPVIATADGAVAVDVLIVPRHRHRRRHRMHGLTDEDLEIRRRAREFVDTLIPYEVEAELAGGVLPTALVKEHHEEAIRRGLYATNMPTSVGGPGLQRAAAGAGPGAGRPGDQRARLVPAHAAPVVGRRRDRGAARRWLRPAVAGERHECYAITEEYAGSPT